MMFAPAAGVAGPLGCIANSGVAPNFNAASTSATLGNVILECTGGTPGAPTSVNFDFILNGTVRPAPANSTSGGNNYQGVLVSGNDVEFQNVPFSAPGNTEADLNFSNNSVNPSQYIGGYEFIATLSNSASIPIADNFGGPLYVGFNDPATLTLQGGTAVAPVSIQVAGTVLAITGSIGGYSSEDYYSFY